MVQPRLLRCSFGVGQDMERFKNPDQVGQGFGNTKL